MRWFGYGIIIDIHITQEDTLHRDGGATVIGVKIRVLE
jgi:hypothetical protein